MRPKSKTVLITGATGTIGKAVARAFARDGCNLILCGLSKAKTDALKREFSCHEIGKISVFQVDVSNEKSLRRLFRRIDKNLKAIDILVTAAGTYGAIGTIEQTEPKEWMRAIEVNLLGTFMTIKYALPFLRKSPRAKIITFAGGGEGVLTGRSSYASSKGGLLRMVETLAEEIAPIDINAISPGAVVSGFVDELIKAGVKRLGDKQYRRALKQKKYGTGSVSPEKASLLAVFLASSSSDGISGKNLSAVRDKWQDLPKHKKEIAKSDIYNMRRIKPKDRGYYW